MCLCSKCSHIALWNWLIKTEKLKFSPKAHVAPWNKDRGTTLYLNLYTIVMKTVVINRFLANKFHFSWAVVSVRMDLSLMTATSSNCLYNTPAWQLSVKLGLVGCVCQTDCSGQVQSVHSDTLEKRSVGGSVPALLSNKLSKNSMTDFVSSSPHDTTQALRGNHFQS